MEDAQARICVLVESITHTTFLYASQALFEKDKLTFLAQMTFQVRPWLEASLEPQADTSACCAFSSCQRETEIPFQKLLMTRNLSM